MKIAPTKENVKPLGRTYYNGEYLLLAYSGTGLEFEFTGKYAEIKLLGDSSAKPGNEMNMARYAVYVNGERVCSGLMDEKEKSVIAVDSEVAAKYTVRLVKLSETAMSSLGVVSIECDSPVFPTQKKEHFVEIVGDSITCGYGVDDEDPNHNFVTGTEDVTKAYSYKTVTALDVDYSFVSISGYGIISGYSDDGVIRDTQRLPLFYEKMGFSYADIDGVTPADIAWDFSEYDPDAVVINLGTNDDSYTKEDAEKQQFYQDEYVKFLKTVRKNNARAKIVCILGIMGNRLYPRVEAAVKEYSSQTGDINITSIKFDEQDPKNGYAADWHPTEKTHSIASKKLVEDIKNIMNW